MDLKMGTLKTRGCTGSPAATATELVRGCMGGEGTIVIRRVSRAWWHLWKNADRTPAEVGVAVAQQRPYNLIITVSRCRTVVHRGDITWPMLCRIPWAFIPKSNAIKTRTTSCQQNVALWYAPCRIVCMMWPVARLAWTVQTVLVELPVGDRRTTPILWSIHFRRFFSEVRVGLLLASRLARSSLSVEGGGVMAVFNFNLDTHSMCTNSKRNLSPYPIWRQVFESLHDNEAYRADY